MRPILLRALPVLAFAALAASCADAPTDALPGRTQVGTIAPLHTVAPGKGIPDRYIVVFHDDVADAPGLTRRLVAAHGGELHYTYQHALRGFSATLSPAAVDALRRNPQVKYIDQDRTVTLLTTQDNAPWGLDRIDQRDLPLNGIFNYTPTGAGVRVYVIDTGIRFDHMEFGGRAILGYDAYGGDGSDCYGHGTPVAATVGGSTYGVAKGVTLVSVRVLDCYGSGGSEILAGVDWVTGNHVKPAVANMSLGTGIWPTLDDAVNNSVAAGVTYVAAAGNFGPTGPNADACTISPARVSTALTVGASTSTDSQWTNSSVGPCVDLFAPGVGITSAWNTSSTAIIGGAQGTSLSAPHVAGVAALYLAQNPTASPATVHDVIVSNAWADKLSNVDPGSPNRLLNSLLGAPLTVALGPCGLSCRAVASGGTGTGYSFTWLNADETADANGVSFANLRCVPNVTGYLLVKAIVTDGSGTMRSVQQAIYCPFVFP